MAFASRKENKGIASRWNDVMDGLYTCEFESIYMESIPASHVLWDMIVATSHIDLFFSCCASILFFLVWGFKLFKWLNGDLRLFSVTFLLLHVCTITIFLFLIVGSIFKLFVTYLLSSVKIDLTLDPFIS